MCGGKDKDPDAEVKLTPGEQKEMDRDVIKNKDELENGPVMNRRCTDWPCCIVFVIFIVGMVGLSGFAFTQGNPTILLTGWDYDGNGCGYSEATKDYPYLYWPAPDPSAFDNAVDFSSGFDYTSLGVDQLNALFKYGTCVKECPSTTTAAIECMPPSFINANPTYWDSSCQYYPAGKNFQALRYAATGVVGHFCYPQVDTLTGAGGSLAKEAIQGMETYFYDMFGSETLTNLADDIGETWKPLVGSLGIAFFLGFIFLLLIRCVGGFLIYLFILLAELMFLAGGFYAWYYKKNEYDPESNYYKGLYYGAIISWSLAGLLACIVCCCWSAIKLGIAVFKATAQFINSTPSIFTLPITFTILAGGWVIFWCASFVFLYSIGTPEPNPEFTSLTTITWSDQTRYMVLYYLFGGLWVNSFFIGACQFLIAACACIWYFTCNSDNKGYGTMSKAFSWLFCKHLGSIGFGSFLIAVIQLIRILFEYYRRKIQVAKKNKLVKALLCLTGYLLWYMEKVVKYMTKNAYIQVALQSTWFCTSAWNAFALIIKNAHRFGIAAGIGKIYTLFGLAFVISANSFYMYLVLTQTNLFAVTSIIGPIVVSGIIGFVVGYAFFEIYSFSADAILQSFLLDEQLGARGNSRPDCMKEFAEDVKKNKSGGCC
mmetsp:Transcript_48467/g.65806  ORF Transcript_48467/g.65806 Transcript_48467/m.65806 type:complete len:655 (-) Transcript_48467:96-2060(-)